MITLARDGMRNELERIWRMSLGGDEKLAKYFLDYRYNPNSCAVYIDESIGRPVAMLHMLDASITEDSEIVPVQYIYAAASRTDYQNRGIMQKLLEYARRYAYTKRQKYMIVVPQKREQFRYFQARGFHRCFYYRNVFMTRNDLKALSKNAVVSQGSAAGKLSLSDIHAVRRDMLVDREGFITWDYQAFKYAAGVHEMSGGTIVSAADSINAGYAFCRRTEDGSVIVSEFIAHTDFAANVIRSILEVYDDDRFEFRLPVFDEFFAPFGEINEYGMIAAVNGRNPVNLLTLNGSHTPYIGLNLE